MSFKAAAWAIECKQVSTVYERVVLIILADCHNSESGRCDPSMDFICERACASKSTVLRAIESLESKGLLTRTRRTKEGLKTSNHYVLNVNQEYQSRGVRETPSVVSDRHHVVSERHPRSVRETPSVVSERHLNQETLNQEVNLGGAPSKICPNDFFPNPDLLQTARFDRRLCIEDELFKFKNHEFQTSKTDWDRAFLKWLATATPKKESNRGDTRNALERKTDQLLGI